MSALGTVLLKSQIEKPYATVRWGTDKAYLVDAMYAVITPEREELVSPFDQFRMKLPNHIHTAQSVKEIMELLPAHTSVYNGYSIAELIKENQRLRRTIYNLRTGQRATSPEPWEEK